MKFTVFAMHPVTGEQKFLSIMEAESELELFGLLGVINQPRLLSRHKTIPDLEIMWRGSIGLGRVTAEFRERRHPYSVSLTPTEAEIGMTAGNGNLSEGIRRALLKLIPG